MNPSVPAVTEIASRLAGWLDREHPRTARFLLGFRWGGLRTLRPDPLTVVVVLGGGAVAGWSAARSVRVRGRRPLPPAAGSPLGAALGWGLLWRWDSRRWRARHVRLVPGLAAGELRALAERLTAEGVRVEVWERSGPGGPVLGLSCRTGDLRRVNREIGGAAAGTGPTG